MPSALRHRAELRDLGERLASEYADLLDADQVLAVVAHAHRRTARPHRMPPTCLALTENVARHLLSDHAGPSDPTRG